MNQPVLSDEFWRQRIIAAINRGSIHQSVYVCSDEMWSKVQCRTREILYNHIEPTDTILDVGCGYGPLIECLPYDTIEYHGIDISPSFGLLFQIYNPDKVITIQDICEYKGLEHTLDHRFDVVIARSLIGMLDTEGYTDCAKRAIQSMKRLAIKCVLLIPYELDAPYEIIEI